MYLECLYLQRNDFKKDDLIEALYGFLCKINVDEAVCRNILRVDKACSISLMIFKIPLKATVICNLPVITIIQL